MSKKIFINGISSISAQADDAWENGFTELSEIISRAKTPDFKKYIKPAALRRMSPAIKMGLTSAKSSLEDGGILMPDAIITGTGQGCKRDTERFLTEMESREESLLSPTSFIQSTHNTLSGQIALNLQCREYNITYTQNSASLEFALQDAQMQLLENSAKNILVGGVEEISELITGFAVLDGQLKEKPERDLLKSKTSGTIFSEGAQFFVLSSKHNQSTYAELKDLKVKYQTQNIQDEIQLFLDQNRLRFEDMDAVFLGNNGDIRYDDAYHKLQTGVFKEIPQLGFKHFSGEYDTASGFALWAACKIFKSGKVPEKMKLNKKSVSKIKNILIYNQYLGKNHSLILLGGL